MEDTVFEKIYKVVRKIPRGKVATYGQIAALAGNPFLFIVTITEYFG